MKFGVHAHITSMNREGKQNENRTQNCDFCTQNENHTIFYIIFSIIYVTPSLKNPERRAKWKKQKEVQIDSIFRIVELECAQCSKK